MGERKKQETATRHQANYRTPLRCQFFTCKRWTTPVASSRYYETMKWVTACKSLSRGHGTPRDLIKVSYFVTAQVLSCTNTAKADLHLAITQQALLSSCYVLGTMSNTGGTRVNKTLLHFWSFRAATRSGQGPRKWGSRETECIWKAARLGELPVSLLDTI